MAKHRPRMTSRHPHGLPAQQDSSKDHDMKSAQEIVHTLTRALDHRSRITGLKQLASQLRETAKSEILSPEESAAFFRCGGLAEEMAERMDKAAHLKAERLERDQERIDAILDALRGKELGSLSAEQRIAFIHRASPMLIPSLQINELVIEHVVGEVFDHSLRDAAEELALRSVAVSPSEAARTFINETLDQMPALMRAAASVLDQVRPFMGSTAGAEA